MFSIASVKIIREILHAEAIIDGLELRDCTAKSFSFEVHADRMAELTFSISTSTFPSNTIAIMAERLHSECAMDLWTPQGDLFEEEKPTAEALHP